MKNEKEIYIKLAILSIVSMIVGALFSSLININNHCINSNTKNDKKEFKVLYEAYDTIINNYYRSVDSETLIEGALDGMMKSLDDEHTMYFNKENKKEFETELSGNYYGIGAQIQLTSEGLVQIVKVFDNSPAEVAGLRQGDIFISIDGVLVSGKSVTEVSNLLKSDKVKKSIIIVKRENNKLTFNVTKANITLFSVSSEIINLTNKKIGYISVSIFGQKTYSQFKNALSNLESQNMESLIIDLRGNTGGYLYTVTNMLNEFINKDKVIYQIQTGDGIKKYKSKNSKMKTYKVIIMIDENSASASEIMASSMKESYGAILVGKKSYGKGTVQITKNLSNGSMIKYTIEKWLTPNGNNIDKEGIKPDYEVDLDKIYNDNPIKENDTQLKKALDILK